MAIKIPEFSDILTNLQEAFTQALGNDVNFDPSTPTGQLVSVLAASFNSLYEALQASYQSSRADQASGQLLDNIASLLNITRKDGTKTICQNCNLTGTADTIIPAGSRAKTESGVIFSSTEEVTLTGGNATVDFISEDFGAFSVKPAQLTVIVDTVSGWDTINNPTASKEGEETETDGQLRNRIVNMSQNLSIGTEGSIKAVILGVEGVIDAFVYVNYSNSTAPAPFSSPAHSVWCVIDYQGDTTLNQNIANAIFSRLPPVITYNAASHGNQQEDTISFSGRNITIKWNESDNIGLRFNITTQENTSFTHENEVAITDAVKNYLLENQNISSTLIYSKIYAVIVDATENAVIEAITVAAGVDPTPSDTVDITPDFYQKLIFGSITFSTSG